MVRSQKLPDYMTFLATINDIKKIEKLNNMKINVFRFIDMDKNHKLDNSLYSSRERNENVVNLLLLERQTNFL
jgi:hypothetical protein